MLDVSKIRKKLDLISLSTYGPRRDPRPKEFMSKQEMIAMSPLGSTQNTYVSKRFAKQRDSLAPAVKKALGYLFPSRNAGEKPPVSKYDSMVRKMSNYSSLNYYESSPKHSLSPPARDKNKNSDKNLMKKLSGVFDFPKKEAEILRQMPKKKSSSMIKLPLVTNIPNHRKHTSDEYISCINYTGEAESEYLKTEAGQKEYKKLYELMLQDSGLYSEIRIRNQSKNRIFYKRMPV